MNTNYFIKIKYYQAFISVIKSILLYLREVFVHIHTVSVALLNIVKYKRNIVYKKMDARSNMIDVIQKLEKLKFENNYTNYKIAKLCGISESTIINIYERNSIPHIDTLEKYVMLLGFLFHSFCLKMRRISFH